MNVAILEKAIQGLMAQAEIQQQWSTAYQSVRDKMDEQAVPGVEVNWDSCSFAVQMVLYDIAFLELEAKLYRESLGRWLAVHAPGALPLPKVIDPTDDSVIREVAKRGSRR